jgi:hypothetical protein
VREGCEEEGETVVDDAKHEQRGPDNETLRARADMLVVEQPVNQPVAFEAALVRLEVICAILDDLQQYHGGNERGVRPQQKQQHTGMLRACSWVWRYLPRS